MGNAVHGEVRRPGKKPVSLSPAQTAIMSLVRQHGSGLVKGTTYSREGGRDIYTIGEGERPAPTPAPKLGTQAPATTSTTGLGGPRRTSIRARKTGINIGGQ